MNREGVRGDDRRARGQVGCMICTARGVVWLWRQEWGGRHIG